MKVVRSTGGGAGDARDGSSEAAVATQGAPTPGTLRSAMRSQAFRRIFAGTFSSNIGTWMQNVTLIALAYSLTGDAWFVGLVTFAQLGPTLLLSPVGGALADRFDRRRIMVSCAAAQGTLSATLALVALDDSPNRLALVLIVLGIGCASAVNGPTANATLPSLVPREDLQPAIAINSVSMNASRVVGPLLGGLVGTLGGATLVFGTNALTYLFVIAALMSVDVDFSPSGSGGERPIEQIRKGFAAARADQLISRVLITISALSLCSLVFIYQMPLLAERQLGLVGWRFNVLFASFALGAASGALAMGSMFSHRDRAATTRAGLGLFGAALAVFGTTHSVPVAFVSVFLCGACYFVIVTSLATTLQMKVRDEVRGRVMGLWMMAWAGLVPLGGLIAGPIIDTVGISPVLLFGAAVAAVLATVMDLRDPDVVELRAA